MLSAEKILNGAVVITLQKRAERGAAFSERFKAATGKRAFVSYGFDGQKLPIPTEWATSAGAFGCCLAHVVAWARELSDNLAADDDDPLTFFEDDAVFCQGFREKLEAIAPLVPDDWEIFHLGGEHLTTGRRLPEMIATFDNCGVSRVWNVNRLHGYVVRRRALTKIFPRLVKYLANAPKRTGPSGDETCFDYEITRMEETGELIAYAATPFLVGQGGFGSDTYPGKASDEYSTRFWNP